MKATRIDEATMESVRSWASEALRAAAVATTADRSDTATIALYAHRASISAEIAQMAANVAGPAVYHEAQRLAVEAAKAVHGAWKALEE